MRHLIIRNFGPLKEADVELGRFNLIIGFQSSGKSCVLKTACFCAWVEKRIELAQSADYFMKEGIFMRELSNYHKFDGYFKADTFISYETSYMKFSYSHQAGFFEFQWKSSRWKYKRSKISYIPSERSVVAAIPNWKTQVSTYDNILDFMNDWDKARQALDSKTPILNLGMSYRYDALSNKDMMVMDNGVELSLSNSSSGVQSLVPLYVHLDYLNRGLYTEEANNASKRTSQEKIAYKALVSKLYNHFQKDLLITAPINKITPVSIENSEFIFADKKSADAFSKAVADFSNTHHCDVYLEEPEDNLFPPTQCQLVNWLVEMTDNKKHPATFFIATHSPYVLTSLLERELKDFHFFFTYPVEDGSGNIVKTASEDELQEIYDNGVDMFFNFEAYK